MSLHREAILCEVSNLHGAPYFFIIVHIMRCSIKFFAVLQHCLEQAYSLELSHINAKITEFKWQIEMHHALKIWVSSPLGNSI